MARNREFDDALDELKMLHDAKNHDYATAENPYKNLEGVSRIGIEPWRGIVIRLMDKFERVQQYCVNGELKIKSEGLEDTFKDIAVYSTLAMILFRKDQEAKYSTEIAMNDLREASEKQQETKSLFAPHVPLNIDDDCLGTPKLKFKRDSEIEKLNVQREVNKYNNLMEDEHEAWLRSKFPKGGENN